jgi:hypothetical protein
LLVWVRSFSGGEPGRHQARRRVLRGALCRESAIFRDPLVANATRKRVAKASWLHTRRSAISANLPLQSWMFQEGAVFGKPLMTTIETSALNRLDSEQKLVKPQHKGPTHVANRVGFRGDIQLTDAASPSLTAAFATADAGSPGLSFLAGQLDTFSQLPVLAESLSDVLNPGGKYFIYVADVKRGDRYQIAFGEAQIYVLPYDDVSVYNELIDFFYLDKTKMKKFDTAAKIDALAEGAFKYGESFPKLTYEEGLARV